MLSHVSLRNFQSWKSLDLELGRITVIVGRGNAGKSALVRALKYALTNKGGDGFIRHGEEEAVVGMAIDDHTLVWRKRRGKGGEYDLDGHEYVKTGTTVPAEVVAATGVRGVSIDASETLYPQIHAQFDAPFIVKASGTKRARILGKLTKLDVLVQAQMLARKDNDRASREQEGLAAEEQRLQDAFDGLVDVPAMKRDYDRLPGLILVNTYARQAAEAADMLVDAGAKRERYAKLDAAVAKAEETVDVYAKAYEAHEAYQAIVKQYADSTFRFDRAEEECQSLEAEYKGACDAQGLCATCPIR